MGNAHLAFKIRVLRRHLDGTIAAMVIQIIECRKSSSSNTERQLQVAFLVRARGMISFEFYLVLENVFAVSVCKFNEQKRPAKVFGD